MLDILITNSEEFLNLALGFSAIFLSLFLILVLIRVFRLLGTLNGVLEDVQDILDLVQNYLWQPARFFMAIKEKIASLFSFFRKK